MRILWRRSTHINHSDPPALVGGKELRPRHRRRPGKPRSAEVSHAVLGAEPSPGASDGTKLQSTRTTLQCQLSHQPQYLVSALRRGRTPCAILRQGRAAPVDPQQALRCGEPEPHMAVPRTSLAHSLSGPSSVLGRHRPVHGRPEERRRSTREEADRPSGKPQHPARTFRRTTVQRQTSPRTIVGTRLNTTPNVALELCRTHSGRHLSTESVCSIADVPAGGDLTRRRSRCTARLVLRFAADQDVHGGAA